MDNDLTRKAEQFLSGEEGRRVAGKKAEIERIAASKDGERVKAMLEQSGFEDAVKRGDTAALRDALSGVMKTDSGRQLIGQLQALMGKK